jgi:hypothetical protein
MHHKPSPRVWFEQWHEPGEFLHEATAGVLACFCADKIVPHCLSEAYIVGAFAWIWRDARGPCQVRLLHQAGFPDAHFKAEGVCLNLEITMALPRDKKMFEEWRKQRAKAQQGKIVRALTDQQRQASAREAIPRAVKVKAGKHYASPPTLLIYADDGRALLAEETAGLTMPWKNCFAGIYLLCGMDVVQAWPELHVLKGKEPFWPQDAAANCSLPL